MFSNHCSHITWHKSVVQVPDAEILCKINKILMSELICGLHDEPIVILFSSQCCYLFDLNWRGLTVQSIEKFHESIFIENPFDAHTLVKGFRCSSPKRLKKLDGTKGSKHDFKMG